ncbi:citrate synthase [Micractinium conductrix]|uniref:Citrate synthase n=1 Tax=Micractinium conductrix TaxID=554055 RepID=A0A2P6VS14_9CHLO|nr:citrate synthase [Micractinium conductrix]|eukprot:PSC76850.1 citrate synthase [Micractinium conductrix]
MSPARLQVVASHFTAPQEAEPLEDCALERALTSAAPTSATERPTPGGGPGTLTVVDNRTGKSYQVAISDHGTIKAADLKQIVAGGDGVGLRTYDNGYVNTTACKSAISYIDGDAGILRYRGYPIEQLAERSNFLEVSYLVVYGSLPTGGQMQRWTEAVMRHSALPVAVEQTIAALPHDAHPMGTILTGLCALSTLHPEQNPALAGQNIYNSREVQDKQIVRLIGKMPTLAALAYHRASGRKPAQPNQNLGYAENFLYMLDAGSHPGYRPNPRLARALDILFILHAEHELNCSTSAARHLASSGVDVYTVASGAVGALYGPLHGGANEAVLRMLQARGPDVRIGSVENVGPFLEGVKNRKERMFGFGHRIYKNYDPRAKIIRQVAEEVFAIAGRDPLIEVALALEAAARSDEYFVKRKLYPNVDFFSGLVYRAMGFPPQFFTVLFAIPRIAGYLAHWRESLTDPDTKIIRPQQDYRGEWLRGYQPVVARPQQPPPGTDEMGPVPPSNAYVRRISGKLS